LDIGSIFISKNKIVVQRALHQKISTNLFIAAYSRFGEDFFCLVNNNDINRKELALCRPQSDQMEFIDFEALIDKSHLKSDILKDEGFTCWQPVTMESCSTPVFVVAFGCRMRFRSFYSGTPIFRHCRSACFATFSDSSRSKLNFFYLPLKMHFDLYVHDGFIQTVFPDQKETFGNFFKFTQNRLKPYNEVCQIPISQELDQYYPLDSSKVGFSIAGSASDDSLFLTVRTWPSRSAADISVKHRIFHVKYLPEDADEDSEADFSEDFDE